MVLRGAVDELPDAPAVGRHLPLRVLFECEFEADIVVPVSWRYMPMKMKNRLSCNRAVVRENVESFELKTFHHCARNSLCCIHNAAERLLRDLKKGVAMVPRDDQRVTQMDGSNIENGNRIAVLVQYFSRCGMMNDITKRAIRL